ncbi:MAG: flavodoxin family protein [Oscillospiraceae bacterium]|jgi:multimeric flavodoxin WrbA|nr:flavodoxin family protein [Oscillospiraceae bacterium]MCI1990453.1 flavodoxin family protein [Oscillospiraceae bacterium]MCI2035791.1 flavodoxin family protein [Oscillospiraceae bacterium]
MKVVAVFGSPRDKGNSSTLVREVLRGAADAGHAVVVYRIDRMNVRGCQGCGFCRANNADCKIDDDLKAYWKDLHECGALVVGSPNYYAQVAGPMVTYMNRHYCLTDKNGNNRLRPGIKLIGVFSQGNSNPEAYRAQYDWYLGTFQKHGMILTDRIVSAGEAPLRPDSDLMRRAYRAGKSL